VLGKETKNEMKFYIKDVEYKKEKNDSKKKETIMIIIFYINNY
jgi:hypothetical protein